jgi:ribosomal protein S18 acetylase RimI-like enzyme
MRYRALMDPNSATTLTIERCAPVDAKEVLALAAQAWPEAERAAYWKVMRDLIRGGQPERIVLLAARQGDQLLSAQVGQLLPGKVAVAWPPQFAVYRQDSRSLATLMSTRVVRELAAIGAELAQALLRCDDEATAAVFADVHFSHAADLLYMAAETTQLPVEPFSLPFDMEAFSPNQSQRLARLLERTYIGTLDCPQMDNLRKTEDVIVGYQAVGEFRPELWQIARHEGADVGCLLVNLHPEVEHAEVVYMALVPEVRGRGWGYLLARHAQWLAREAHCVRVVLAVDAANEPAICPYGRAGFLVFDRRAVWIKKLP